MEINPEQIEKADIVFCIPSRNLAGSIFRTAEIASIGLVNYFGHLNSVIVNCDWGSTDRTPELFLEAPTEVPKISLRPEGGITNRGDCFRELFRKALDLGATAVLVAGAASRSLTPDWIHQMGAPLLDSFEYVSPLYVRHKYDGLVNNNLVYPMTRALYGRRIRQPIAGDSAFSGRLAELFQKCNGCDRDGMGPGVDLWMATLALSRNAACCQAFLGCPKPGSCSANGVYPESLFRELVETMFNLMIDNESFWERVKWSRPTAVWRNGGSRPELTPPEPKVEDPDELFDRFREAFPIYAELWRKVFKEDVRRELDHIRDSPKSHVEFPANLWARVLFDSAVAYRQSTEIKDELVASLRFLYFGKASSYMKQTDRMTSAQAELFVEQECDVFEEVKSYLIRRWKGD